MFWEKGKKPPIISQACSLNGVLLVTFIKDHTEEERAQRFFPVIFFTLTVKAKCHSGFVSKS